MTEDSPPYTAGEHSTEDAEPAILHYVVLDIETAPRDPELLRQQGFAAPPRSYTAQTPQTMLQSDEAYWRQWHEDTAQLDPGRSYVCAVGLYLIGGGARVAFAESPDLEATVIAAVEAILCGEITIQDAGGNEISLDPARTAIVGHNLIGFDLPYLRGREAITGQGLRIEVGEIIDTKKEWDQRYLVRGGGFSSLDHIAASLGWPTKPGNGRDFWVWPADKRREYLMHDLRTTGELAVRLGLVPEPARSVAVEEEVEA